MEAEPPPRVSVIIPTYNRATLVCKAIDSVLEQTFGDHEILVIDDGSTDGTESAVAGYGQRVRYFWQDNRGMSAARNRGIDLARGEYLALLDSDDLWMPFKLELMVSVLDRFPEAGFAFSNFSHLHADGRIEPDGLRSWHHSKQNWDDVFPQVRRFSDLAVQRIADLPRTDFKVYLGDIYRNVLHEHWVLPTSTLIRTASIRSGTRFPDIDAWWGDSEFFARLSHRSSALFVEVETVLNRCHEDEVRLTRKDPIDQVAAQVALIDRLWRADAVFMASYEDEVNREQCRLLVQLARLQLAAGRRAPARQSLDRADALAGGNDRKLRRALRIATMIPGSSQAIRLLRTLKNAWRFALRGPNRA